MDINCKLEKLFKDWATEHETDVEYDSSETGIAKNSFTPDGPVCGTKWNQLHNERKKKVLYLLREANGNASTCAENGKIVDGS